MRLTEDTRLRGSLQDAVQYIEYEVSEIEYGSAVKTMEVWSMIFLNVSIDQPPYELFQIKISYILTPTVITIYDILKSSMDQLSVQTLVKYF